MVWPDVGGVGRSVYVYVCGWWICSRGPARERLNDPEKRRSDDVNGLQAFGTVSMLNRDFPLFS